MSELEIQQGHDPEQLTPEQLGGEIRFLTNQARRQMVGYGIQIGYRLKLAHEKVGPHGWADWLKRETGFSKASASRLEALYEGYGEDQGSLFGIGNKFPTLEKITISNALLLLAVPEDEREQVAAELDAEHLSSRELAEAIKARKAAEERAEKAEKERDKAREEARRTEEAEARANNLQNDLRDMQKQLHELESRPIEVAVERDEEAIREAAEAARREAGKELDALRETLAKVEKAREKAEKERDKAKEEARQAAEGSTKKEREEREKAEQRAKEAEEKLAAAEQETAAVREQLAESEKRQKISDGKVTAFGIHFKAVQEDFNRMMETLREIQESDPETANKLRLAAKTILTQAVDRIKMEEE